MNNKKLWKTVSLGELSEKAIRFFEESDGAALESLFGRCESIEEIEKVADALYDEIFGL